MIKPFKLKYQNGEIPAKKAGKDQKSLYGSFHFLCGKTDPVMYSALHLETM